MLNRVILMVVAFIMNACVVDAGPVIEEEPIMAETKEVGGWSVSGNLARLTRSGAVHLQVNFKDKPGPYTVQFNIEATIAQQQANGPIKCEAEIVWTVKGNPIRRVMSVSDGATISGVGQAVDVKVRDVSTAGTATNYNVVVTVAPGTRPSSNTPPIYDNLPQDTINASGTDDNDIPQDVGVSSVAVMISPNVIGTAIGAYDILVRHLDGAGGVLMSYDPRQEFFVPLAPGAVQVRIATSAAAPTTVFKILWGIDG